MQVILKSSLCIVYLDRSQATVFNLQFKIGASLNINIKWQRDYKYMEREWLWLYKSHAATETGHIEDCYLDDIFSLVNLSIMFNV